MINDLFYIFCACHCIATEFQHTDSILSAQITLIDINLKLIGSSVFHLYYWIVICITELFITETERMRWKI